MNGLRSSGRNDHQAKREYWEKRGRAIAMQKVATTLAHVVGSKVVAGYPIEHSAGGMVVHYESGYSDHYDFMGNLTGHNAWKALEVE